MKRQKHIRQIIVCVTPQDSCMNLVEEAKSLAVRLNRPLEVLTVLPKSQQASDRAAAVIRLNELSKESGLPITIYYSDMPINTVADHARESEAVHIITGLPGTGSKGFAEMLSIYLPAVPVTTYTGKILYTLPAVPAYAGAF